MVVYYAIDHLGGLLKSATFQAKKITKRSENLSRNPENVQCNRNSFCSSLESATRAALCKSRVRAHYEARQVIELAIGRHGQLMLLDKGQVITVRARSDGKQKGIEYLGEGNILGLSRLFDEANEPGTLTVYAKSSLEVCLFSTEGFEQLCMTYSDLARQVIRSLCHRFSCAINDIEHISLDTSEEKVLYLVRSLSSRYTGSSRHPLPFTHEELGLLAGISRVTVTRVIDHLRKLGVLTTAKRAIVLSSPNKASAGRSSTKPHNH